MIREQNPQTQSIPWPVVTTDNIPLVDGPKIKVRALRTLYYEHLRRREGDVFYLTPKYVAETDPKTNKVIMENGKPKLKLVSAKDQLSGETMEVVDEAEPESITTAKDALKRAQDDLSGANRRK